MKLNQPGQPGQPGAIIIAAVITGIVGVLITGYFQLRQAQIPIEATQTAEAKQTLLAQTTDEPTPIPRVSESDESTIDAPDTSSPKSTITPSSTPKPTNIPIPTSTPPHSTPTTKPDIAPLAYNDDFSNSIFDGTYNDQLWKLSETTDTSISTVKQQDGNLFVSQQKTFKTFYPGLVANRVWSLSEIGDIEASLMLADNFEGETAGVEVFLQSTETDWWLDCRIDTCQTASWCENPDKPWMMCASLNDYAPDSIGVDYNTWHTTRMEIDPETVTFKFYFDGTYYDTYTPPNAQDLKDDTFRIKIGLYVLPETTATGYVDNVLIGLK